MKAEGLKKNCAEVVVLGTMHGSEQHILPPHVPEMDLE